jgi:hypothetical protein
MAGECRRQLRSLHSFACECDGRTLNDCLGVRSDVPVPTWYYARRHLAVPLYHDRAEGTGTLDAAEPSERAKITELWLAGRGIPRDERAPYQAVVEELWAGEPPQVTEQALRMAAGGLSRDAILDKLVQDH